ncbi:MAG: phosphopantetheine adenylyltransferase [Pseudomonadales bacterium]|nr:phosphopantetheine adenylyltransferase [Pseudomonadales bacterium]
MYERIVTVAMLVIAVIHLTPIVGVLGTDRLATLYGIAVDEPNLEVLLRHRAVLFGILGGFFLYAAFSRTVQPVAFAMAGMSILSFFYLAWTAADVNDQLRRVVAVDVIAAVGLLVAIVCYQLQRN